MSIRFSDTEVIDDLKGRFHGTTGGGKIEGDCKASDKMEKVEATPLANLASKHSPFPVLPPPSLEWGVTFGKSHHLSGSVIPKEV